MPKFVITTEESIKTIRNYGIEAETIEEALEKLNENDAEKYLFEEYERSTIEEIISIEVGE